MTTTKALLQHQKTKRKHPLLAQKIWNPPDPHGFGGFLFWAVNEMQASIFVAVQHGHCRSMGFEPIIDGLEQNPKLPEVATKAPPVLP